MTAIELVDELVSILRQSESVRPHVLTDEGGQTYKRYMFVKIPTRLEEQMRKVAASHALAAEWD